MTRQEIETGLLDLGLTQGDIVILHSSFSSFGAVEGGPATVLGAFLNVLGNEGTLVVPAFGALGILADMVREHPNAVCSVHPLASVAAIGACAEALCADHWKADTAHGDDTPYMRIAERGGYVCLAGVDQDRNTTLHTVEALLKLPYLSSRTVSVPLGHTEELRTYHHFPGPHRDFIGLDRLLQEKGVMRMRKIGNSVHRLMKSQALIDVCMEAGRADPAFALCDNPNCTDCVGQRTILRKARFDQESFSLVASSGLAGRDVPEMIENLRLSGICRVELDFIQGRAVHTLDTEELRATIQELLEHDCVVTALRCSTAPSSAAALLEQANVNAIDRVVLPLSCATAEHVMEATRLGVTLSFVNSDEKSDAVSDILMTLREQGVPVGFCFNAAQFARSGEKPFLFSYKQKLRSFVDQLDVEDCCFDGSVQALAQGNAEIKEMISILRCASFAGPMVLTTSNRKVADLRSTVARFEALLEAM